MCRRPVASGSHVGSPFWAGPPDGLWINPGGRANYGHDARHAATAFASAYERMPLAEARTFSAPHKLIAHLEGDGLARSDNVLSNC
jgi:hypothetical protein